MAENTCGGINFPPEELSSLSLSEIAGIDFLAIADTVLHTGLDCYMIYVAADTVFATLTVGGVNVVAAKGLTGVTVTQGTLLPFGKEHCTGIDLTSGIVIAHLK